MTDNPSETALMLRHEITQKELVDPYSAINTLPRVTLRSWGFDPDGEFVWWDDPATGSRVITQAPSVNPLRANST